MTALQWFDTFYAEVRKTPNWRVMSETVEGSEWHREANVAVHTDMCIEHYIRTTAGDRDPRHQVLTLVTLLFHDFGKPEAEETLERKDGSGTYHRYAGHEPKSANEFLSFVMSHRELTLSFFEQGFGWDDIRKIKFMIEHHLPFGLKNPTKRANLKRAVNEVLGNDVQCFYDQLWSDCCGRISDDHETKRANVVAWIDEFRDQTAAPYKPPKVDAPTMFVMVGPVGSGKTTWIRKAREFGSQFTVVSEDDYRVEYFVANADSMTVGTWMTKDTKEQYAEAWKFCFDSSGKYDKYARDQLMKAVATGQTLILDRTNQTRKSRSPWISAAKQAGYKIETVEFYISEALSHARQKTRIDKDVPPNRTHQIYMAFEVPWDSVETDAHTIVPTFD